MYNRYLGSLIIFVLSACSRPQPMHISIEDRWSNQERAIIINALNRWEVATNNIIDFIISDVPFHDENGFDINNLSDQNSVVYKIDVLTDAIRKLDAAIGPDHIGYGLNTDVLIIWFRYLESFNSNKIKPIDFLEALTLHEIGHHIGLGHIQNHHALMTSENIAYEERVWCISKWDLESFCSIYGCNLSDMKPECEVYE